MEKEVDLLHGPITKSLIQLSLPIMATSLIQMAYNLVDMFWIGSLGSGAVAAVGAAGMFLWLSSGLTTLIRIGSQVKVGHSLGAGDKKQAISYAQSGFQLGIIAGILYGVLAILLHQPLIAFFKLNSQEVITYANEYLMITSGLVIFSFVNQIFTGVFTARGNSQTPFIATCIGLALNLIFDPLFIFGWKFIPRLEVFGAGFATVLAQLIVTIVFLWIIRKDHDFFGNIKLRTKMQFEKVKEIIKIGLPMGLQSMIFTCISMTLARMIAGWGDNAVAAQKLGTQIESISWMSADGFSSAINVFVAQNIGASNLKRVKEGIKKALVIVVLWGILCTLVLLVFPKPIFQIFLSEQETVKIGVTYLMILAVSEIPMCIEYAMQGAFSGFGNTLPPSIVSIVFTSARIPMAMLLTSTALKLGGIWWSISISSCLKGAVLGIWFIIFLYQYQKKQKEKENGITTSNRK